MSPVCCLHRRQTTALVEWLRSPYLYKSSCDYLLRVQSDVCPAKHSWDDPSPSRGDVVSRLFTAAALAMLAPRSDKSGVSLFCARTIASLLSCRFYVGCQSINH